MNTLNSAFIIAPSGSISKKNLLTAKKRLESLKFNKIYHRADILSNYLSYAGDYLRRSSEINEAYKSPSNAIFTVLGGMGSVHLLSYLDYPSIKKSGKILIGSSDVTILLNGIYKKTGARCLHGPNIGKDNVPDKKTLNCLIDAINKKNYLVSFAEKDILVSGKTISKIVGGNLELLGRSLGTEFEIETDNKILFLEDYKMKSWRVFDILWQLKISGKFDRVSGVILGKFTHCGKDIDKYLKEFFKGFKCPVIMNQPFGHEEPNITIPLGEKCVLDTSKRFWKIKFN